MVEINPSCALDLWSKYDHVLLENMLEMQMQMRTPPEEREQDNHNNTFKQKLQQLVDNNIQLVWGTKTTSYEQMLVDAQQTKTIERKIVPYEIQAKLLAGLELTQEELLELI